MAISPGFRSFLTYDYMDQYQNWHGWSGVPSDLNTDKVIQSDFYTFGLQYMANRDWGVMLEAPVWNRYFQTTDESGGLASVDHGSLADVRVMGMYTGISEDMSTGIQFGLKLPTGPYSLSLLDRDTQIGTGTTDLLLGGYQMGQEDSWGWYAQAMWQHAFNYRDGYRPGDSFDFSVGVHFLSLIPGYVTNPDGLSPWAPAAALGVPILTAGKIGYRTRAAAALQQSAFFNLLRQPGRCAARLG